MKRQYTVKALAQLVNVSEGTVRSWIMKPIEGQPYSSENINYENLREKLTKYFESFSSTFGFSVDEIEIVKAQRKTKNWLTVEDIEALEPGDELVMHNYSLKTELTFVDNSYDTTVVPNKLIKIFKTHKNEYKAYTMAELTKDNIKLERRNENA